MRSINIGVLILFIGIGNAGANSRAVEEATKLLISQYGVEPTSIAVTMRENVSFNDLQSTDEIRAYSQSGSIPHGVCVFRFDIVRNGVVVKSISAPVNVSIWRNAYVARREIKRGNRVRSEDLTVERCDVTNSFDKVKDVCDSLGDIRAVRNIAVGKVIERDMIEAIPAVNRGDEVLVRCEVGSIEITTIGVAKDDGCPGDEIEVVNKSTKRRILAEVMGPGTVVVKR